MKVIKDNQLAVLTVIKQVDSETATYIVLGIDGDPRYIHINKKNEYSSIILPYNDNAFIFNLL
jgi:hypothetical protein